MAWERSFEARVLEIRKKEMKYQRLNYIIEVRPSPVNWDLNSPQSTRLYHRPCGMGFGAEYWPSYTDDTTKCQDISDPQECIAYSRHANLILAFYSHPKTSFDTFDCFHFSKLRRLIKIRIVLMSRF